MTDGIHCLPIPTPFAVGRVNCYLIEDDPLTLVDTGPNSGKALDELERGLAALAPTGLPGGAKMEILALLTGFVAGYVNHERAQAAAGITDPERIAAHVAQLRTAVATGAYPELARVLTESATAPPPTFEAIAERMIKGLLSG